VCQLANRCLDGVDQEWYITYYFSLNTQVGRWIWAMQDRVIGGLIKDQRHAIPLLFLGGL
jgi:hypothetical protein